MNYSKAKIPGVYLHAASECLTDFGINQKRWLQGSPYQSIDNTMLDATVSYDTLHSLVIKAIELSNNPTLGVLVGHRLTLQSHGILGYALMNCENLESATQLLEQYIPLRFPLINVSNKYQGDQFVIELNEKFPLNEIRNLILEAILVAIKSALYQLVPQLKKRISIHFPYANNKEKNYDSLKDCKLIFNSSCASISIPKELMLETIPLANLAAYKEAEILCAKELKNLNQESAYKSKVKQKLLANSENFPTQTIMASWFNMTSRTLHRRLINEGTSYREILEDVKQTLAISYLTNTDMTIKEIGYFLGYEDDRNFSRAFRRWQGMSPSQYRLHQ
ncbi:MAG: AraC family transcriptional regulator ligand-binding domain-containing protein [Oleispira sp.]|nr:AraC family transcriptional regulator ligand-binding domain-containing protein [Oleispira sp.]